ncbi:hypothetical protein M5D96_000993, partial [Drosophila gunungcola]
QTIICIHQFSGLSCTSVTIYCLQIVPHLFGQNCKKLIAKTAVLSQRLHISHK